MAMEPIRLVNGTGYLFRKIGNLAHAFRFFFLKSFLLFSLSYLRTCHLLLHPKADILPLLNLVSRIFGRVKTCKNASFWCKSDQKREKVKKNEAFWPLF
jgi:hypothetical protein